MGAGVKTLYEVTPLEGLKNKVGEKAEIIYAQGYIPEIFDFGRMFRKTTPEELKKEENEKQIKIRELTEEALSVAKKADLVLFVGGNNRAVETEGSDRKDIKLPSGQDELLRKIAEVNPEIITVLVSGAPNDLNVVNPLSKALLISWFNGTEGGNALADVLLGNISPSGRLPFTLPVKLEDSPAFALKNYSPGPGRGDIFAGLVAGTDTPKDGTKNTKTAEDLNTAYYSEESLVGYRWYDTKNIPVLYPFGHGLTYTKFQYASIKTDRSNYGSKDIIELTFDLTNTGKVAACEVPQVYVHRINPSVEWPYKELKGFSRINLDPGTTGKVVIKIPVSSLQYWNESKHAWDDDPCDIELLVGASAGDIRLKKEVKIK
jgi:beta-glucosidase